MLLFSDEELKAKYTLLVPLTSQKQLQEIDFNSCALAMLPPNGSRLCLHSLKHICLLHFSSFFLGGADANLFSFAVRIDGV